jgi:hypothetical protein
MPYFLATRGMGEYPGYYCYDADRPNWLPYWIDDLTESACKWSPSTIAGNIKACFTGDPQCGAPTPAQANPALSGPGVAAPGAPANVPTCTGLQTLNVATNTCELNLTSTPTLLMLFAAGAGLFILGGR